MLNRDFSKPKKDYILKNKFALITVAVVLIASLILTAIIGFNTTPEFDGGYMFSVNIGSEISDAKLEKYTNKIDSILDDNNLELYSVQFKGEGELSSLQITYMGEASVKKADKVNQAVASYLKIDLTAVSDHEYIEPTVSSTDYIYTTLACMLILVSAVVFTIFRHNIGYALSMLGAGLFSVVSLILVFGLLRLEVTNAIFTIILLTLSLTLVQALLLFEEMKKLTKKAEYKTDLSSSLKTAIKNIAKILEFSAIALFVIGLVFVMFGTSATRQIAVGYLFGVVIALASFLFVLPFIYNLIMDKININKKTYKQEKTEDKKVSTLAETGDAEKVEQTSKAETAEIKTKEQTGEEKKGDEVVMELADNATSSNDEK